MITIMKIIINNQYHSLYRLYHDAIMPFKKNIHVYGINHERFLSRVLAQPPDSKDPRIDVD